jgi:hypothetical protein
MEHYDHAVYSLGEVLSGHTLKHVAAAAACFSILRLFRVRRLLETAAQRLTPSCAPALVLGAVKYPFPETSGYASFLLRAQSSGAEFGFALQGRMGADAD